MFRAPGLVFCSAACVGFRFHVLYFRTRFRRYRGRWVPFSYFACGDSSSAVPRASCSIFMFCTPGLGFRRYRGSRVPFSCFARPDSFSAVPRESGAVFMFSASRLVFGGTEGVGSCFHFLRARTHFWRYRGRRIKFSCLALPDLFSAVPSASGSVFMFYAPGHVFGGTEGVGSRFMFCVPGLIFGGTEGVVSRFHVLRAQTTFRLSRWRRVPFSSFALPDSFSAVPSASGPVFMFCAP
jgi:hypothetical protein